MEKGPRPEFKGRKGPVCNASRKAQSPKGRPEKRLCALYLLFGHPLSFIGGGSRERKILIPLEQKRITNRGDQGGPGENAITLE
ncbi:MAG: hypothetical protein AMJ94_07990 [Deltaproteobacteria bacterium SM23_61]|nr:MAG: hypothetical protein AMJ94_07990 [Deltaproteobacteria bacterium SM23_61]